MALPAGTATAILLLPLANAIKGAHNAIGYDWIRSDGREHGPPAVSMQAIHCVGYDVHPPAVEELRQAGADGAASLEELISKLEQPRVLWMMLPAAIVDRVMTQIKPLLAPGDILVDGGNSYYQDDIRRAADLVTQNIHYVDVGVSGGIWGYERGYCLMIGGEVEIFQHLDPIFKALAPGTGQHAPDARTRRMSAPPIRAICIAVQMVPVTSSKWCITALSTA